MKKRIFHPFGYEYCYFSKWNWLQKVFIYLFGVVDLPTRVRSIALRKVLKGRQFHSIVDAGCACGFYSFYFARKYPNARIYAYDIDVPRLKEADAIRSRLGIENLTFHYQDLAQFDAEAKADLIICFETFQYIPDNEDFLKRFHKAMCHDGRLILHIPAQENLLGGEIQHRIYKPEQLRRLLTQSGFRVEKMVFTFGRYHTLLSDTFSVVLHRFSPMIIIVYPILLALMWFSKFFHSQGKYFLVVATPLEGNQPERDNEKHTDR